MSEQIKDIDWAIGQEESVNITEELDYIHEQEEIAYAKRETEHKIAAKQVALKHALICALMLQ